MAMSAEPVHQRGGEIKDEKSEREIQVERDAASERYRLRNIQVERDTGQESDMLREIQVKRGTC